jgi:hypothetical protein
MAKKMVSFKATKQASKPVIVKFTTKSGQQVSFSATKKVSKPVKVKFYTENNK